MALKAVVVLALVAEVVVVALLQVVVEEGGALLWNHLKLLRDFTVVAVELDLVAELVVLMMEIQEILTVLVLAADKLAVVGQI